jgi:hypothetical protein
MCLGLSVFPWCKGMWRGDVVEGFMVHGTDSWEQRVIKQLSTTRVKR